MRLYDRRVLWPAKAVVAFTLAVALALTTVLTAGAVIVWSSKASMPTARAALAAAAGSDGTIYAIGGYNGAYLGTNEAYDPVGNSWRTLASMPTPRRGLGAARLGTKIYAVGGFNSGVPQATLQVYNPTTNHWSTKAPMPTARGDLMAVAGSDGKLYAIGGWNSYDALNDQIPLSTVEAYTPSTNTWATMAPMPTPRYRLAGAILNGKIYAIGGVAENTSDLPNVEAFDVASNTWAPLAPLPNSTDACNPGLHVTGRAALGAAATGGKVYAIGGTNEDYQALCSVLAYNPVTNVWKPAASMPTKRGALAVARSGTTVYAIGGATFPSGNPSGVLGAVEAF